MASIRIRRDRCGVAANLRKALLDDVVGRFSLDAVGRIPVVTVIVRVPVIAIESCDGAMRIGDGLVPGAKECPPAFGLRLVIGLGALRDDVIPGMGTGP